MSDGALAEGDARARARRRTIFQKGAPGRRAFVCPPLDVPAADPEELLPARFRRA